MMGWNAGFGGMGWFGWLGPLAMIVFWVVVLGLGAWLVSALFHRSSAELTTGSTALDILKRRYARGELTRDEYQEGRRLLEG